MTKKDYERIAFAFGHAYANAPTTEDARGIQQVEQRIVSELLDDNPRFDPERYRARREAISLKAQGR